MGIETGLETTGVGLWWGSMGLCVGGDVAYQGYIIVVLLCSMYQWWAIDLFIAILLAFNLKYINFYFIISFKLLKLMYKLFMMLLNGY